MALAGRTLAWLNLAYRFGRHILIRLPGRVIRRGADMQRFLDAVIPEGYTPLSETDRAMIPAAMNCIHCGLCAFACPELRATPANAWQEAWTFVAGPSRSMDRAALVLSDITPCAACDECTAACPMDVPIRELVTLMRHTATTAPQSSHDRERTAK
jgi:succinate dehydrogenase/fumarate reductase-like Fe-S protein